MVIAGHAWNQVKIGGRWFNVDLTNDRNRLLETEDIDIRNFLKSDTDFENIRMFSEYTYVEANKEWRFNFPIGQNSIKPQCKFFMHWGVWYGYGEVFCKDEAKEVDDFFVGDTEPIYKDGFAKCYTDAHEFFKEKKPLNNGIKNLSSAVKSFASKFKFGLSDVERYYRKLSFDLLRLSRASVNSILNANSSYDEMDEI